MSVITTNNNNIDTGTGTVFCSKISDKADTTPVEIGNSYVRIGNTYRTTDPNKNLRLIVGSNMNNVTANKGGGTCGAIFEGRANDINHQAIMDPIGDAYYAFAPIPGDTGLYIYSRCNTENRRSIITAVAPFFTGQHGNFPLDNDLILNRTKYVGLLVSSADEGYVSLNRKTKEKITGSDAIQITEALPVIKITDKDKDPAVWGVLTNIANENVTPDGTMLTDDDPFWSNGLIGKTLVRVNGLGEGAMWVTNINGNICNGDFICSSIIPGYGRKQDDDLFHNYTAAKSTMSCNFDLNNNNLYQCKTIEHNGNTYIAAYIGVSYHCS